MTSETDFPHHATDCSDDTFELPPVVLAEVQSLLAELLESRHPAPNLDDWHVSASELDVVTAPAVRVAWLITVMDRSSRSLVASRVIFEPQEGEVAA